MQILIVTPDLVGPIKNGGIGTHCYHLARLLAKETQHHVNILFTLQATVEEKLFWIKNYANWNITLHFLPDYDLNLASNSSPQHNISYRTYNFIKQNNWDIIHFQDYQANGFVSIQAKRTGIDFHRTTLITTVHGPSQWNNEGNQIFPDNPIEAYTLYYMEQYCISKSDIRVFPTKYMYAWSKNKQELTPNNETLIVGCPYIDISINENSPTMNNIENLAFFGRLETRKGLELFCEAILIYIKKSSSCNFKKIFFIGKFGACTKSSSQEYLKNFRKDLRPYNIPIIIENDLDNTQALAFLQRNHCLATIPSLADNHPYTIVECIETKIPFIAARVGGIPELVAEYALFDPTPVALAKQLLQYQSVGHDHIKHAYNKQTANYSWLMLNEQKTISAKSAIELKSRISVIIAHRDQTTYLKETLAALMQQTYKNIEIIIIDDGSTESLEALQKTIDNTSDIYLYILKESQGPANARNIGAAKAQGEYIVFVDADNIPLPNMIETMYSAIQQSQTDCLTTYFEKFDDLSKNIKEYCLPIGPVLPIALTENILGDTNFIIKKELFLKLSGFNTNNIGLEDWEFLLKLAWKGYSLDVIPTTLFRYRLHHNSLTKKTDHYKKIQHIFTLGEILGIPNIFPYIYSLVQAQKSTYQQLQQQYTEKQHLQNKQQFLQEQASKILSISQSIQEQLDCVLLEKQNLQNQLDTIQQKNKEIIEQLSNEKQTIQQLQEELEYNQKDTHKLYTELMYIKTSFAWTIILFLWKVKDIILPQKSLRKKIILTLLRIKR